MYYTCRKCFVNISLFLVSINKSFFLINIVIGDVNSKKEKVMCKVTFSFNRSCDFGL